MENTRQEKSSMTPSLEDYLEMIYFLEVKSGAVRVTDVANELNIKKPSVNKAINILKGKGYVCHEPYGLLSLTDAGRQAAEAIARRHAVLKTFLSDIMGVPEKTAEDEACRIEHTISAETLDKIDAFTTEYLKR